MILFLLLLSLLFVPLEGLAADGLTTGQAPSRFVTRGAKLGSPEVNLEPEIGLEYDSRQFGQKGTDLVLHRVNAQAGGRLNLAESLFITAAAKVPVYGFEGNDIRSSGPPPSSTVSRHSYDFLRLPGSNLSWSGEVGMHLGLGADLSLYYDQTLLNMVGGNLQHRPEEQFGTRIIFRFR